MRAAAVDAEHRVLVAAIAAGDGDAAEAAMRDHLDKVKRALGAAIEGRRLERRPPPADDAVAATARGDG